MGTQAVFNQNKKWLEHHQPKLFENLWIEITEPLNKKLLVNVACFSNVNLSKFFVDEMTSEIYFFHPSPYNVNLFGDNIINIVKETEKQL